MGDVVRPKPPQWERRSREHQVVDDLVINLVVRLNSCITAGIEPTVVQLAALRMLQKAILGNYANCLGRESMLEIARQASDLASMYQIEGVDDE